MLVLWNEQVLSNMLDHCEGIYSEASFRYFVIAGPDSVIDKRKCLRDRHYCYVNFTEEELRHRGRER